MKQIWILVIIAMATTLYADLSSVEEINQKIESLEDQRDKLTARAARLQDTADRLQFDTNYLVEARKMWNLADEANAKAKEIQKEIDDLKLQRASLLKNSNNPS